MTPIQLTHMLRDIPSLLSPGQDHWLYSQVAALPDDALILEIGTYHGYSTAAMAYGCLGTNRKIVCIDAQVLAPCSLYSAGIHWKNLGLSDYIIPIAAPSERLVSLNKLITPFDFFFIDGDHEFEAAKLDYLNCRLLGKVGSRICLHDVVDTWPGPKKLWDEIASKQLKDHQFCGTIASGTI